MCLEGSENGCDNGNESDESEAGSSGEKEDAIAEDVQMEGSSRSESEKVFKTICSHLSGFSFFKMKEEDYM